MSRIFNIKEQSCFEKPSIPGPIAKQLTIHYSFIILKLKYSKNKCAKPQKALANSSQRYLSPKHSNLRPVPPRKSSHHSHLCRCLASHIDAACHFKVPNPIGSMGGLVYLPTFTHRNQPNVGKYTVRPMDPYGLSTKK